MSELSPDAQRLIRMARAHDRPPPGARARVRARVDGRLAGATLAGALLTTKSVTVFAKTLAALALVAVAVRVALARAAPTPAVAPAHSRTTASTRVRERAVAGPPPVVDATVATPPRVVSVALPDRVSRTPAPPASRARHATTRGTAAPVAPTPPPAVGSIAEELRALQLAQSACRAGETPACLARLDAHARAFPAGALREEALGMRALVLCRAGDVAAARAVARSLRAAFPRSPRVSRLGGSCAEVAE